LLQQMGFLPPFVVSRPVGIRGHRTATFLTLISAIGNLAGHFDGFG